MVSQERRETMVRTYKGTKDYEKDVKKLGKDGWAVVNTVERKPRAGIGRILTLGIFTLFRPPKHELVVTYSRVVMAKVKRR